MGMIAQYNKMTVQEEIIQYGKFNQFVDYKTINECRIVFTSEIRGGCEMNEVARNKGKYRQKDHNAHHDHTALD
jgi:hypothetical protein